IVPVIDARIGQKLIEGAGRNRVELRERIDNDSRPGAGPNSWNAVSGMNRRENGILIEGFEVEEPEEPVFLDRPAERKSRLQSAEERVGIERIAFEQRVRRDVVIAEERECAAMQGVATHFRHDIDRADRGYARRQIEIE